jgi:hypothetical protein
MAILKHKNAIALALLLLACLRVEALAFEARHDEYEVKAAFLINFARYVDWPARAFHGPGDPLIICVLTPDPFGDSLSKVSAGQSVDGRAVTIRRLTDGSKAEDCRMLFAGTKASLAGIALPTKYCVLVANDDIPAADKMAITFRMENGKVRFAINLRAATDQEIQLSSRLLALASEVRK